MSKCSIHLPISEDVCQLCMAANLGVLLRLVLLYSETWFSRAAPTSGLRDLSFTKDLFFKRGSHSQQPGHYISQSKVLHNYYSVSKLQFCQMGYWIRRRVNRLSSFTWGLNLELHGWWLSAWSLSHKFNECPLTFVSHTSLVPHKAELPYLPKQKSGNNL